MVKGNKHTHTHTHTHTHRDLHTHVTSNKLMALGMHLTFLTKFK